MTARGLALALAFALTATALPALAAKESDARMALEPGGPFSARAAERYGRCVVKADAAGGARYIRALGTAEEARARKALQPVLERCENSLGAWERDVDEAARRVAVRKALIEERVL